MDHPFFGLAKVETFRRDADRLRRAIRSHDSESALGCCFV